MTLTVGVTKAARPSRTAAVWKLSVNWNTGGRGVGSHITPTPTHTCTPSHPTPHTDTRIVAVVSRRKYK